MIRNTMAHADFDKRNIENIQNGSEIDVYAFMESYLKNENYINMLRAL